MDNNNEHFYRAEYNSLLNQNKFLRESLDEKERQLEKQKNLLEECWERIYYKRAWLTLSDGNLKGLRKHIDEIKKDDRYSKLMLEE